MGSCVSLDTNSSDSVMKLRLPFFWSKTDKLKKIPNGNSSINRFALKSQWSPARSVSAFHDLGIKEESFFDSQPWLESDCDDDFFSVNGDFTPSRGNTPVHHNFSMGTPRLSKVTFEDRTPFSTSEPSPTTDKKKRLSELFEESMREAQNNIAHRNLPPESPYSSSYVSGMNSLCSSEKTANGDSITGKQRSIKSVQCCLPSLVSCHSFDESKKKMSPAVRVNDNP